MMQRVGLSLLVVALALIPFQSTWAEAELQVGLAEADITPPQGFPMAGYYHERLATGARDPLKAKALVLRQGEAQVAIVACDLTGIATDLTAAVRRRLPGETVILTATHSHTAPDYTRDLYRYLGNPAAADARYAPQLIDGIVSAVEQAKERLAPVAIRAGSAQQQTAISFNRRFLMRDGSVRTWMSLDNPEVVRPAGPIDPEVGIVTFHAADDQRTLGVYSNFALHLDTVGGMLWSADYPYFVEQLLRTQLGGEVISVFGTGCCGDINHVNPASPERNTTEVIGTSLANTIADQLPQLTAVTQPTLAVRSVTIHLPLREVTDEQIDRAVQLLPAAKAGENVDFYDLVEAHRSLVLDHLRHKPARVATEEFINWGLSRELHGIGSELPVEVHAVTLGQDVAMIFLPGEIFVELGQTIKKASPFSTTLVVELSNAVETVYVPTRAAYAQGSYEVTNSFVQPGSGEMLVEAAVGLLRDIASQPK